MSGTVVTNGLEATAGSRPSLCSVIGIRMPPSPAAMPVRGRPLLRAADAAERVDVIFGLLLDHVDDVVEGHDANPAVVGVDHWRRDQVAALEAPRHLRLVVSRAHYVRLRLHQL